MNDPIDDGLFKGYFYLAMAIIRRATKDTQSRVTLTRRQALLFLHSPEAQHWAEGWGVNFSYLLRKLEQ